MGMFDYIRSSYPLGKNFAGECQTKDIDEHGIGGTMSQYWICPVGQLHLIDYSHTADFVHLKEGDEGYNYDNELFNFKWIPNGNHGRVRAWSITKYILIYPSKWDYDWEAWPECRIHFRHGMLMDYEVLTKGDRQ